MNGPDQVLSAEYYTTCSRDGKVKLRIPENGKGIEICDPISLPGLLMKVAQEIPESPAYCFKNGDVWVERTYTEYLQDVKTVAKAFLHLGLEKRNSVCILGANCPEWLISNVGAIFAGGIACGIYVTNSAESCHHVAYSSAANIIVVEDTLQLQKIQAIKHRLPALKAIVQFFGEPEDPSVISWKQLLEIGAQENDKILGNALKTIAINQCSTLVYTSGTTGNPKGVMLSHDNFIWNVSSLKEIILENKKPPYKVLSYLPFSHIAGQVIYVYFTLYVRGTLYFARKDALKGSVLNTYREVQPNIVASVPRIYEKIYDFIKQSYGDVDQNMLESMTEEERSKFIYKIRKSVGYANVFKFVCGAAPLPNHIKKGFYNLNMHISESFGMSESSGLQTTDYYGSFNVNACGKPLPGMKTKLRNPIDGQGEVLLYGRHIFMGYLDQPDKTKEVLDENGWLSTGDLGSLDEDQYLTITGRIKEIIITAGGENVAPFPIENVIKSVLPIVSNAVLVGDKKKYLTILLTLKTVLDSNGLPSDTLLPEVQEEFKQIGCPAKTVTEVMKISTSSNFVNYINLGIQKYNDTAISNAQRIQKFSVLPVDFSIKTGEVGPTLKLKRNVITTKFKDFIDRMYQ